MGKDIIALLLMVFVISCIVVTDNSNSIELEQVGCDNFDGTKFLLSGGTGTPSNIQEISYEIGRLNWICGDD